MVVVVTIADEPLRYDVFVKRKRVLQYVSFCFIKETQRILLNRKSLIPYS